MKDHILLAKFCTMGLKDYPLKEFEEYLIKDVGLDGFRKEWICRVWDQKDWTWSYYLK